MLRQISSQRPTKHLVRFWSAQACLRFGKRMEKRWQATAIVRLQAYMVGVVKVHFGHALSGP
jgi:hypothetical protein